MSEELSSSTFRHLTPEEIDLYIEGLLLPEEHHEVERHAETCADCRNQLSSRLPHPFSTSSVRNESHILLDLLLDTDGEVEQGPCHLSWNEFSGLLSSSLSEEDKDFYESHIASCQKCREYHKNLLSLKGNIDDLTVSPPDETLVTASVVHGDSGISPRPIDDLATGDDVFKESKTIPSIRKVSLGLTWPLWLRQGYDGKRQSVLMAGGVCIHVVLLCVLLPQLAHAALKPDYHLPKEGLFYTIRIAIPLIQSLVLGLFLYLLPKPRISKTLLPQESEATLQFYHIFRATFALWFVEYLAFAYMVSIDLLKTSGAFFAVSTTVINLLGLLINVCLYVTYYILSYRTTGKPGDVPVPKKSAIIRIALPALGICLALTAIEAICKFLCLGTSHGGISDSLKKVEFVAGLTYGFLGGTVMAVLFGRLDSKLLNLPPYILWLLYMYAIIQPLYAFFSENPLLAAVMFMVACLLKSIYYISMCWTMVTGRLLYYIAKVNEIVTTNETEDRAGRDSELTEWLIQHGTSA